MRTASIARGRRAILAIAPTLAGRIAYDPPLPGYRDQLTQRMPLGTVAKCMAVYDEPFWRAEGLSGQATSDRGPVRLTFDNSPPDGSPGVLLGFLEGRHARELGRLPAEERRTAVDRLLRPPVRPARREPERLHRAALGRGGVDARLLRLPHAHRRLDELRPRAARADRPAPLGRRRVRAGLERLYGRRGALGRAAAARCLRSSSRVSLPRYHPVPQSKERQWDKLDGKKVAFMATDGVEQVELTEPWKKVEDEGGTPELISLESGEIQGFNHLDKGDTFPVDRTVEEANEADYDGLVLPGGVANPDFLRDGRERGALRALVLRGAEAGGRDLPRPLDARRGGRRARPDDHLVAQPPDRHPNAGGNWVDEEVVVDNGLVSSRKPDDLRPSATRWRRRSRRDATPSSAPALPIKRWLRPQSE